MSTIIELAGCTKRFPGVLANNRISLQVAAGEIHALVGENGAGKSTLMKILYGLYRPDEGAISVRGNHVLIDSPRRAIALGIGMVHQHFMLIPRFTVTENVILGSEPARAGRIHLDVARRRVQALCDQYGLALGIVSVGMLVVVALAAAGPVSPEGAAGAYVSALTGKSGRGLEPFFAYNWDYRVQIARMRSTTPQVLWKERTDGLQLNWRQRLGKSVGSITARGFIVTTGVDAWDFLFEPSARGSVVELRNAGTQALDLTLGGLGYIPNVLTWRAFVRVEYAEDRAPFDPQGMWLREAVLDMGVVQVPLADAHGARLDHIGLAGISLDVGARIVDSTMKLWPVPSLTRRATIESLTRLLQDNSPTLWVASGLVGYRGPREGLEAFLSVLKSFGFEWSNVKQLFADTWDVEGLVHPQSWSPFRVPGSSESYVVPMEPVVEVLESAHTDGQRATVAYRYRWQGCGEPCMLYDRLKPLSKASNGETRLHAGDRHVFVRFSRSAGLFAWTPTYRAVFQWSREKGWQLSSSGTPPGWPNFP